MASLIVDDLTPETLESLEARARQSGRTVQAEARWILESSMGGRRRVLDSIERDVARQSRPTTAAEVDEWLRASRERTS